MAEQLNGHGPPSPARQAAATTAQAGVSSGSGAFIFAIVTVTIVVALGGLGKDPGHTELLLAQGSIQTVYQTVFSVGWSLIKQYLAKHGYTV